MSRIKRIIFLGTGTSGAVPNITCLMKEQKEECVCHNYLIDKRHPDVRNNTSILVVINDGKQDFNVLVDCGKTFRQSALRFFQMHNISRIDMVLITHGHADAFLGLDDLREFSANGSLPVYCSRGTLKVIENTFPYLVDTRNASGGGDVAKLCFHVIADEFEDSVSQHTMDPLPFINIFGIKIEFVPVHHGFNPDGTELLCYGFKFGSVFAYISDAVKIPVQAAHHIKNTKILVLDALKMDAHKSHFSLPEALSEFNKLNIGFGLLVGFCHKLVFFIDIGP
eukprot:NODE_1035_length_1872_cov_0.195713.p1 type:complete len:281 gc:universal NODE_1035_length_1872_cov_0.195713:511-1353(+)